MNVRDLRYLAAVADSRHFGHAAQTCHVSQPTLSAQIRKLEEELGVLIFERNNKSVAITPAGSAVVAQARTALDQIDQIAVVASNYQDPMSGEFRLGMIPTIAPYLIPGFLSPLSNEFPNLDLTVSESVTAELEDKLLSHELDAAILATAVDETEMLSINLFDEPFWLVHPSDHAFYYEDVISLKQLKKENLLLLSDAHCLSGQVRQLISAIEPGTGYDFRATSMETLLQLVSNGRGCTLIPALALAGPYMTGMGLIAKPIKDKKARRRVSLVARKRYSNPDALTNISELIKQHLPNTVHVL
ncbi:MAG TPA: LysR family transcriptional regulator [Gammaproteobacteria bacterium]|nr:LysR family transcriptional regulator [Gammaproteobacteria bacterium]|tara:strand:+ start:1668 stop:2573 length:906 start_codon:yes stop_codon:yes gene_type:complete